MQPITAFCADFNWDIVGAPASPGMYAHADPEALVDWTAELGANTIQTFHVGFNGWAWYPSAVTPMNPGLPPDWLTRVNARARQRNIQVMGYLCLGANQFWQVMHADEVHPGVVGGWGGMPIPTTERYLDWFCALVQESATHTTSAGFMIDWFYPTVHDTWLPCERVMWQELLGEPFPSVAPSPAAVLAFDRAAMTRAWQRIKAAEQSGRKQIIWPSFGVKTVADPLWQDHPALRESDWILNESPDHDYMAWIRAQMRPDARLVQCAAGWTTHRADQQFATLSRLVDGWYGFASVHPTTCRPWTLAQIAELRASNLAASQPAFAGALTPNLENLQHLRTVFRTLNPLAQQATSP
jgi:hypothetical protein